MARDHGQRSVYAYSGWEIDLIRREMRLRGSHVPLGGRAFDIVAVLVGSAGQLVTKEELLEQIWSGVFVEEIALRVHIAAIRKAFGSDRGMLETAVGRDQVAGFTTTDYVLLSGGLVLGMAGTASTRSAHTHLMQSIWHYNRGLR